MVYDRINGRTMKIHTRDVAVKRDLYTITDKDGNESDYFERAVFAPIDAIAAGILPKFFDQRPPLTTGDRDNINAFIALQRGRTLHMHDTVENMLDLEIRGNLEAGTEGMSSEEIERFIEDFEPNASEELKAEFRAIIEDPSQKVTMDRQYWIMTMCRRMMEIKAELNTRQWLVANAQEGTFLTSDVPVAIAGAHPLEIATALRIYWPLSPDTILILDEPGSFNGSGYTGSIVPHDSVREINQRMADQSARQTIWRPETGPHQEIVLPTGAQVSTVNGEVVEPGQRLYDKIRELRASNRSKTEGSDLNA